MKDKYDGLGFDLSQNQDAIDFKRENHVWDRVYEGSNVEERITKLTQNTTTRLDKYAMRNVFDLADVCSSRFAIRALAGASSTPVQDEQERRVPFESENTEALDPDAKRLLSAERLMLPSYEGGLLAPDSVAVLGDCKK